MKLTKIIWREIELAHAGQTKSYSDYDVAIKSKFLEDSWSGVPCE